MQCSTVRRTPQFFLTGGNQYEGGCAKIGPSLSFPPGAPLRRGGVFLRRLLRRAGGADKTCGPGRRKLLHPTFCGCAATYVVGLRPISRVLLDPSGSIYFRIFEHCHAVHRVHLACSVRQDDNWAGCQANRLGASVAEDNDSRPTRRLGELCTKG